VVEEANVKLQVSPSNQVCRLNPHERDQQDP